MLTRISGQRFVLNCDLIERVDGTSDTVVSLVDGKKYVVTERPEEIVAAARRFRGEVLALSHFLSLEDLGDLLPAQSNAHTAPAIPLREV